MDSTTANLAYGVALLGFFAFCVWLSSRPAKAPANAKVVKEIADLHARCDAVQAELGQLRRDLDREGQ